MNLAMLLKSITPLAVKGALEVDVSGIVCDSRKVASGSLFVAIKGHTVDGVHYVTEALAAGATVVVSEDDLDLGAGITHVQVPCTRRALAQLATLFYGDLSRQLKVVGITGTNGKTTTAYMIRDLLRDGSFLPGLLGTVAYEFGDHVLPATHTTPEAPELHALLFNMKEVECDSVVMEVSSHALALHRVDGIDFSIGVFTNLTQDHLDYHHDMETYFSVKKSLFDRLERGRSAIINLDDPWGKRLVEAELRAQVVTYGFDEHAMVRATELEHSAQGTRFWVSSPWGDARVRLHLLGRFNVHNALAALAACGVCGIDLARMVASLGNIQAIPGRLERVENRKRRQVFVDYAHTDDALRNVLSTLREICTGRLIVVFGCGGNRDAGKRKLMGLVASELADYSIVTSDNPRNEEPGAIALDILTGFAEQAAYEVELDRYVAITKGLRNMERKDILLVAGKGHEAYQECKGTIVPFDDRETVREILGSC